MRAFVTGGTGFIGNRLALELRRQGWDVVCLTRRAVTSRVPGITTVPGNLLKPEGLRRHRTRIAGCGAVFHLGAKLPGGISAGDFAEYLTANAAATALLVEMAEGAKVPAFVYASSISVERQPIPQHPYSISKLAGEKWCEAAHERQSVMKVTSLRITSPYGPGMPQNSVLPLWAGLALEGRPLAVYGTGERTQNFVHVDDVVRGLIAAAQSKKGGVYALGGPESVPMCGLAETVVELAGQSSALVVSAGIPDLQEAVRWNIDIEPARQAFGYAPRYGVRDGLRDYISFRRAGGEAPRWYAETPKAGKI